jgi:hypothetical protein
MKMRRSLVRLLVEAIFALLFAARRRLESLQKCKEGTMPLAASMPRS